MAEHIVREVPRSDGSRLEVTFTLKYKSCDGRCDRCGGLMPSSEPITILEHIVRLPSREPYRGHETDAVLRRALADYLIQTGGLAPIAILCSNCAGDEG